MDDIYFSDKKKKIERDQPASSRRISSDEFIDTDYTDENFNLDFKNRGTSQAFSQRETFSVRLPDDDIISQGDRTPKGRPISEGGESFDPPVYKRQPVSSEVETPSGISDFIGGSEQEGSISMASQGSNRNTQPRPQTRTPQSRVPHSGAGYTRTPQGQRVNSPNGQRPVRMVRAGSSPTGKPPSKPTLSKNKIIAFSVIGVVALLFISLFGFGLSALGGLNYDDSIVENAYVDESTLATDKDVINVLFIGCDLKVGEAKQRSDTMMLFSIDKQNKKLKLTSFLRDSYVYIPSKQYNTKLNASFAYGGAQLVMDTLEYNFGVKIDHYIMVDFNAFTQFVDLLGGVTVDGVTEAEVNYWSKAVKLDPLQVGTNELTGYQALLYCRIRYLDNDFRRTERQRKVISAILSKTLKTNPFKLIGIVKEILPNISTDISQSELLGLGMGAALRYIHYDIVQQQIPAEGTWSNAKVSGQAVLKMDIYENADILKSFLYNKESGKDKTTEAEG